MKLTSKHPPVTGLFTASVLILFVVHLTFAQSETPREEADRLMKEAGVAITEKRPDEAIAKATRILELFPSSGDIFAIRGTAYLLKADSARAKVEFTSVINSSTATPRTILIARRMRGMINYQSKLYEDAIADLSIAISMNPGNAGDHSFRGWSHFYLGRNREAVTDFDKVITINPKGPGVRRFRAQAHMNLGNYQLAVDDITEELKLSPNAHPESYKIRANAYRKLEREDLAKADELAHEKAVKADNKSTPREQED